MFTQYGIADSMPVVKTKNESYSSKILFANITVLENIQRRQK